MWWWWRLLRVPWTTRRSNQSTNSQTSQFDQTRSNQSWIFIGRTDAEAEAPILWPPDVKSQLIRKDPDAGKDWKQEEKAMTEDEMVGWHHRLNGHEFDQAPGVGDGQGSLSCSPWGCKELDTTEQLNWTQGLLNSQLCLLFCSSSLRTNSQNSWWEESGLLHQAKLMSSSGFLITGCVISCELFNFSEH